MNPFETDIKERLFIVDVSIDWPNNKFADQRLIEGNSASVLRQKSVNTIFHSKTKLFTSLKYVIEITKAIISLCLSVRLPVCLPPGWPSG